MKFVHALVIVFACVSCALAKKETKLTSESEDNKTSSLRSEAGKTPTTSTPVADTKTEEAAKTGPTRTTTATAPTAAATTTDTSSSDSSFLSNLFSLAGIGSKNVATTERFDSEEHTDTAGNETEHAEETAAGHHYFAMWRYLSDGDCKDGNTGGEYMTAFTGHTNECKFINDMRHGKVICSADGSTYTAEYYADDKCKQHTATFVTDEPVDTCHSINGNVWKTTCSKVDLSDENPYMQCFAGSEMVHLESGNSIPMDQVQLGDRILVGSGQEVEFADVVYLPHAKNSVESSFVEIETVGAKSVKMTAGHYVLAGDCNAASTLKAAKDLAVGQCIDSVDGQKVITRVSESKGYGIYSVVTSHRDGIVIVNGFKASSFATNHYFVNTYYNIHRMLYNYGFQCTALNTLMTYIGLGAYGVLSVH